MRTAIEEVGGKEWKKTDLPQLFRQLEKEISIPLCRDQDGPQLSHDTFKKYMSAAKKALLFGIPFSMAYNPTYEEIPKVKALVDVDKSNRPAMDKFRDALRAVRNERRHVTVDTQIRAIRLPTADTEDDFLQSLAGILGEASQSVDNDLVVALKEQIDVHLSAGVTSHSSEPIPQAGKPAEEVDADLEEEPLD